MFWKGAKVKSLIMTCNGLNTKPSSYPWKRIILTLYLSPALIIKTRCKGGMTFSEAFTVLEKSEKQTMEYDLDVVVNNTCKQLYKQEEMI